MKITIAKNSGFCFGVEQAVLKAKSLAGENTYTFGNLIHNERVCEELEFLGIKNCEDPTAFTQKDTVIIRSHGIGKSVEETLIKTGAKIVDMTCPFVRKIHKTVEKYSAQDYLVIILGKSSHPEVEGIKGRCKNYIVFSGSESTQEIETALKGVEKACLVEQTTFSVQIYNNFLKKIAKCNIKTLDIFNTICYTTYCRQEEATNIAVNCDVVLVIGSSSSSNTVKLYDLCKSLNERTYLVSSCDEVKSINFSTKDAVGITAGASVPKELIMEVKEYMSDMNQEVDFATAVNATLVSYKPGKRIKGTVIEAQENGIVLRIGGKNDAFIAKEDVNLDGSYNPADYAVDTELEVKIIGKDKETGMIAVSKKAVDEIKEADKFVDTIRNGEVFEIKIDRDVKGGLLSKLGTYTIFVPASHIKVGRPPKDTKQYVGKKLSVSAIEIDDAKHKIVASAKAVEEAKRAEKEEIFWANVVPNVVVSGVVKRFTSFGAFVSVDGFDCLAHVADLSWYRVAPEEVLEANKTYEFVVLSADREKGKVSLGYKQLQPHPFVACMEKHPVGSTCKGKVVSVVPFGAFVEVEPKIEGLVHVSEISRTFVKDINEVIKVGDEVEVKVISYDEGNRKINLSIKECLPEEEKPEVAVEVETEEAPKKVRKTKAKKVEEPEEEKEWSEETSNNPFAALLKDFDAEDDAN